MPTENAQPFTVALIGGGSIARVIARELLEHHPQIRLASVLVHDQAQAKARGLADAVRLTSSLPELLSWGPALLAECADHSGLAEYGAAVLEHGTDLVVASVGALAGRSPFRRTRTSRRRSRCRGSDSTRPA